MINLASYFIYFMFVVLFSGGCIAIGYVVFGKMLDKMTRRNQYVALGGELTETKELSPFIREGIERLPAPNLQTFEALLITMETLNTCLEDITGDVVTGTDSTDIAVKRKK